MNQYYLALLTFLWISPHEHSSSNFTPFLKPVTIMYLADLVQVNDRKEIDNDDISSDIESGDLFGYQIEAIGDLDGDGVTDLATIKFSDDSGEANAGSILILFMNSDGTVKSTNEIIMDASASGIGASCIVGDSTNRDTGSLEQIAFVGDLDGDGKPTLALGANSNDHGGIVDSGAVYMLELNADGTVDNCLRIIPGENGFAPANGVYREADAANLGWPLIATDLNGDGQNELLVGANSEDNNYTDLWPLFLTTTGAVSSHPAVPISGLTIGIDSGDFIDDGKTISGTKIVLGVQNGGDGGGAVFIVNLNSAGAFVSSTEIAGSTIAGIASDERFGSGVAPLGDMDGDGINDILVGNEAGDDTNNISGEAHILFLNSDDTLKESQKISNESENTRNGSTPFAGGDLFSHGMALWQEDGTNAVIAIGAHQDDTGGANAGAIHLFYLESIDLGLAEINTELGFNIYPNPTRGYVNIHTFSNDPRSVTIFDLLEKNVLAKNMQHNGILDVTSLNPGIYFIRVKEYGKTATQQLIIK